jgi:hypothetical protein
MSGLIGVNSQVPPGYGKPKSVSRDRVRFYWIREKLSRVRTWITLVVVG